MTFPRERERERDSEGVRRVNMPPKLSMLLLSGWLVYCLSLALCLSHLLSSPLRRPVACPCLYFLLHRRCLVVLSCRTGYAQTGMHTIVWCWCCCCWSRSLLSLLFSVLRPCLSLSLLLLPYFSFFVLLVLSVTSLFFFLSFCLFTLGTMSLIILAAFVFNKFNVFLNVMLTTLWIFN